MRQYLSKGKRAEFPDGLIPAKAELVAHNEAVVYRNFIQGAGPRGIGVGYPEKVNLAFDAGEDRIALIWQGAFIDASRHRTGRAQGFEPPLGVNVVSWTPGAPFARLDGPDAPWPAETGHAAGYQFRGYRLEGDERRPVFMYSYADVNVEDDAAVTQLQGAAEAGLRRTLTLHVSAAAAAGRGGVYQRAAVGGSIEPKAAGAFLVDKKVTVKITGGGTPVVRDQGGKRELLVPVEFNNGEAKMEETLTW